LLFNSPAFAVFFPVVAAIFFLLPHRFRWFHLLLASCYFYAVWRPAYILIVLFTTTIDYVAAIGMEGATGTAWKRTLLFVALCGNCGILFVFKYFDFMVQNVATLLGSLGFDAPHPTLGLLLPLGISFHTFQAMSYAVDVYRGRIRAERHLGIYFLFVIFFPQLVAGPIERAGHMLPQLRAVQTFDIARVVSGLKLMGWGLWKKVVIADRLAPFVDAVYSHPRDLRGWPLALATVAFAYQIYCDFSGYSDIALGSAEVLGFRLTTNFRAPYSATDTSDFWRRWHISLSSWFRDYVYIPLGGNRVSRPRQSFNVLVTFLLSGLWHGASWTFVAWGAVNGLYVIASSWTASLRAKLGALLRYERCPTVVGIAKRWTTFGLTCIAWVFFRARTFEDAAWVLAHSGDATDAAPSSIFSGPASSLEAWVVIASILVLEIGHVLQEASPETMRVRLSRRPVWVRFAVYYLVGFSLLFFGKFESRQFIYFQF
jgi:D-alanyl-lipoteichoic acid acyltransferase DltB (MBOAT superfamily)